MTAPFVVAGPGIANEGRIDASYATVMDIAPTLLEFANAAYPDSEAISPMLGESMVDFFAGKSDFIHDSSYVTTLFFRGHALLRQGNWKLSTLQPPLMSLSLSYST